MAQKYVLTKQLKAVPLDQPIEPGASVVEVITTQEFAKLGVAGADTLSALRTLTEAESTYLDVFPDSLIGSFAVPDKKNLMGETLKFAFYLNKTNLIFIDEGQVCTRLLDDIERIGYGEFERALLNDESISSRAQRAKSIPAVEQVRRREGNRMGR